MTPREAMELAVEMAKEEKNLVFALNDANMAYSVCGLTPVVDALMQHIMHQAAARRDAFSLASAAHAYHRMLQEETTPA